MFQHLTFGLGWFQPPGPKRFSGSSIFAKGQEEYFETPKRSAGLHAGCLQISSAFDEAREVDAERPDFVSDRNLAVDLVAGSHRKTAIAVALGLSCPNRKIRVVRN
jgi:hypothetical protein